MKIKLTPVRRTFILAAITNDGFVWRSPVPSLGSPYWAAGEGADRQTLRDTSGHDLVRLGLIERVLQPGSRNTERWGHGYRYRITDLAREAVK